MRSQRRPRRCRRHTRVRARETVVIALLDLITALEIVERVYENVHLLADEGIVPFDVLDLRPAIAILRELVEEQP